MKRFDQQIPQIQKRLLAWYRRSRRSFPWRKSRDGYSVWVSEIMLQQTRTGTVVPYFERFIKAFPDVSSLAGAKLDQVLKAWEGLGYYQRARNLHRAAGMIMSDHKGKVPRDRDVLLSLPGIGVYTAGAIASIAYGVDEPVLDGNVSRVLARVFRMKGDPATSSCKAKQWRQARELMPAGQAGRFNEALMDLGATVCVPGEPGCVDCPLEAFCQARKHGEQGELPVRKKKKAIPHYTVAVGVIWKKGRILIDRRQEEGLLGGLWEFPGGKRQGRESLKETVSREVREELGIDVKVGKKLAVVRHAYSHFRITLHAFECQFLSGSVRPLTCTSWKWVLPVKLGDYAFPRANQKIIEVLK